MPPAKQRGRGKAAGAEDGVPSGSAAGPDVLTGRPDLEADALQELRNRQRALKAEAKRVQTELKNKKRQKTRALRRCAALHTRDIVQVLLERGTMMPTGVDTGRTPGAQSSGGPSAAGPSSAGAQPPEAHGEGGTRAAETGAQEEPTA